MLRIYYPGEQLFHDDRGKTFGAIDRNGLTSGFGNKDGRQENTLGEQPPARAKPLDIPSSSSNVLLDVATYLSHKRNKMSVPLKRGCSPRRTI